MSDQNKQTVLFVCTHNSSRSIIAEYLLRDMAGDRFDVHSAGAAAAGKVHPLTLQVLKSDFGIDVTDARSKSIQEFANRKFDFIFTLCREIREICITWPKQPEICHWGIHDPTRGKTELEREIMFLSAAKEIHDRVKAFSQLSDEELKPYRMTYK